MSTVLIRNEALKTTKRPAARITLGLFAAFLCLIFGQALVHGMRGGKAVPFSLPHAWEVIGEDPTMMAAFFAAILITLLVSSEFTWRTARQNVIDGLSREQWFMGKLMLFALVCLAFFATQVGVGAIIAAWGTHAAGGTAPFLRGYDLELLGADLLAIVGLGSIAFLAAFLTRSAGPAMAVFFFYIALFERFIIFLLSKLGVGATVTKLLPMALFSALPEARRFDPEVHQKWVAALTKAGKPIPAQLDTSLLVGVGLGWIALLLVVSFVVYQRRDL